MVYRQFTFNILLRILLLFAALSGLAYTLNQTNWLITPLLIFFAILLILGDLIRYVQKTNRDLSNFLLAIRHRDYTSNFTSGDRGGSFPALQGALNQVMGEFRKLRREKEAHHQYLQTVVEHVAAALICLNDEGEVILMNQTARQLLHRPFIKNIQSLDRTHPELLQTIRDLGSAEKDLVKIPLEDQLLHLAVHATSFKLQDKSYKLISLQNIKTELEENEVEAWQKLIRVLTHEIMNSVTPIISLSSMINQMLENPEGEQLGEEEMEDMRSGLKTIESRSQSLLEFVRSYRRLTRVPIPNFEAVPVKDLFSRIHTLLRPDLENSGMRFIQTLPDDGLIIQADGGLVEQVLINLIKNAKEALIDQDNGQVKLIATRTPDKKIHLQVKDNGPGIDDEYLDKIFIPFFTTKRNGSGIGLSLSRQIMRMHKGSISAHSIPNKGTIFTLEF